jgi:hypothetical protein
MVEYICKQNRVFVGLRANFKELVTVASHSNGDIYTSKLMVPGDILNKQMEQMILPLSQNFKAWYTSWYILTVIYMLLAFGGDVYICKQEDTEFSFHCRSSNKKNWFWINSNK